MKHTRLVPQIRCQYPGCNKSMFHLHSTQTQSVYGCPAGHIRKLPRGEQPIPTRDNPPNSAA